VLYFHANAELPKAVARKLCDGNFGPGESKRGSASHSLCLRFSIACILWISLKLRLKAIHSKSIPFFGVNSNVAGLLKTQESTK